MTVTCRRKEIYVDIVKENGAGTAVEYPIDAVSPCDETVIGLDGPPLKRLYVEAFASREGVAAVSVSIYAKTEGAGKLDPWRRKIYLCSGWV